MKNQSIAAPRTQASGTLIRTVYDELWLVREPARVAGQQRFMKSSMPFMGMGVPVMRKTARAVFDRYPPHQPIWATGGPRFSHCDARRGTANSAMQRWARGSPPILVQAEHEIRAGTR